MKNEEQGIIISAEELIENGPDIGITFCEDCRQEHVIQYYSSEPPGHLLGIYRCKEEDILHSLDKWRIY